MISNIFLIVGIAIMGLIIIGIFKELIKQNTDNTEPILTKHVKPNQKIENAKLILTRLVHWKLYQTVKKAYDDGGYGSYDFPTFKLGDYLLNGDERRFFAENITPHPQ